MRFNLYSLLRGGKICNIPLLIYYRQNQNIFSSLYETISIKRSFCTTNQLFKFVPDKSKYPVLNEKDLEEQFVQGSGPGGQNVNRLQNCVVLKHIPTGIVARCHEDRLLQRNRKLAREKLLDLLDQHYNGENSVSEQKKRYRLARDADKEKRAAQLRLMKQQYKESLKQKRASTIPSSSSDSPPQEEEEVESVKQQ